MAETLLNWFPDAEENVLVLFFSCLLHKPQVPVLQSEQIEQLATLLQSLQQQGRSIWLSLTTLLKLSLGQHEVGKRKTQ